MGVRLGAGARERASGRGKEASRRARVFDSALAACAADVGVVPRCETWSFVTHALSFTAPEMTRDHRTRKLTSCDRRRRMTGPVIPLVSIGRVRGRLRAIVASAHLCFVDSSAVNALRAMGAACLLAWSSTRAFPALGVVSCFTHGGRDGRSGSCTARLYYKTI